MKISEKSYKEVEKDLENINLLIITANEIETFHVRQNLLPPEGYEDVIKVPYKNQTYFIGTFGQYQAVHVQCGRMGAISAGGAIVTATNAIDAWLPKAVLMIGVAMGVNDEKQSVGDVLICETVISYENQRIGAKKTIQRGEKVGSGSTLLDRFKNLTVWNSLNEKGAKSDMIFGPILSGEKLIDNLRERNKILAVFPDAVGAEMEGSGLYTACKNQNVHEWILVKGICDYGDGNKNVDKNKRQNLAAESATSICLSVFGSRIAFENIGLFPINDPNRSKQSNLQNSEILKTEMVAIVEESVEKNTTMHTAVQITVSAFLGLSSYEKAVVIEDVGLPMSDVYHLSAYELDKAFFQYVKSNNLLSQLWQAINNVKPFEINTNPFL